MQGRRQVASRPSLVNERVETWRGLSQHAWGLCALPPPPQGEKRGSPGSSSYRMPDLREALRTW